MGDMFLTKNSLPLIREYARANGVLIGEDISDGEIINILKDMVLDGIARIEDLFEIPKSGTVEEITSILMSGNFVSSGRISKVIATIREYFVEQSSNNEYSVVGGNDGSTSLSASVGGFKPSQTHSTNHIIDDSNNVIPNTNIEISKPSKDIVPKGSGKNALPSNTENLIGDKTTPDVSTPSRENPKPLDFGFAEDGNKDWLITDEEDIKKDRKSDLFITVPEGTKEGDKFSITIGNQVFEYVLKPTDKVGDNIIIKDVDLSDGNANLLIEHKDIDNKVLNRFEKTIKTDFVTPDAVDPNSIKILEDLDGDGNIISSEDINSDKKTAVEVVIPNGVEVGDKFVITSNGKQTEYEVKKEDINNGKVVIPNISFEDGNNAFSIKIIDTQGREYPETAKSFSADLTNPSQLRADKIYLTEDTNRDSKILGVEDIGQDHRSSLKLTLPEGVQPNDKIEVEINGEKKTYIIQANDLHGNREITIGDIVLTEGNNQAVIKIVDNNDTVQQNITKSFLVDTVTPSAININNIAVVEDGDKNDKILGVEDLLNDKRTNIEVTLPDGIQAGDKIVVTSQNQEFTYTVSQTDLAGDKVIIQDVAFIEGNNEISIKIRDNNGINYSEVNKSFIVDTTNPTVIDISKIIVTEDPNRDGKILKSEDVNADHTTSIKITIPDGTEVGDRIEVNIGASTQTHVVREDDLQGNREITVNGLVYSQGANLINVKIVDVHGNTHSNVNKNITVDTIDPSNIDINKVKILEDSDLDGTIIHREDVNLDKKGGVEIELPSGVQPGDQIKLSYGATTLTHNVQQSDINDGKIVIPNVAYSEGLNNLTIKIVDTNGREFSTINKDFQFDSSNRTNFKINKITLVEDANKDNKILGVEDLNNDKTSAIEIELPNTARENDVITVKNDRGNQVSIKITNQHLTDNKVTINGLTYSEGTNQITIEIAPEGGAVYDTIVKSYTVDTATPEAISNGGIKVVEDADNNNKILGSEDLLNDKRTNIEITLPNGIQAGDRVIVTSQGVEFTYTVKPTDAPNSKIVVENVAVIEGNNSIDVKIVDTHNNSTASTNKTFIVDTTAPSVIDIGNIKIIEDSNNDGKILGAEDLLLDHKTSIEIILPQGVEVGDRVVVDIGGNRREYQIQAQDLQGNRKVTVTDVDFNEGTNDAQISIVDVHGNTHSTIIKTFEVDTVNPSALDVNGITVVEDPNNDGKILGVEDVGNNKKTDIEVTLPTGISVGDKVVVTSQNQEYIYTIQAGDVAGQKILVQDIPFVEGINSVSIKMRDKHGTDYTEVTKSFIVDTVTPENITVDSVSIVEDANNDGKILKTEDIDADHTTSIKVILPNNIEVGDKIRIELNGNNIEYVVKTNDLQGNREITINNIVYQEGVNRATIKVIDKHNVTHSTVQKSFTVDTLVPDDIQTITIVEDDNGDGKILSSEEQNADKLTNIDIILPNNIAVGDRVVLTHSGNVELEYIIKQGEVAGNKITIADVPYTEGVNNISLKIIDVNGQETNSVQKSFNVDTTNPSAINVDKVIIMEDIDGDGKILSAEDLLSDHTTSFKITIPEGSEIGDRIEITIGAMKQTHIIQGNDLVGNKEITINNIVYQEGTNRATIKIIDSHGNTHSTVTKDFIVDLVNPSNLAIDNIHITEDPNRDGKILKSEDLGLDHTTSFKVVLPNGVQVGDKVEISIGNSKREHVIEASDLQGNREVTIDNLVYVEGANQAIIKIIDSHGVTHSTITKDFMVDTVIPSDLVIGNISVLEDANSDNKILSTEDMGSDKQTDIRVVLPDNIATGDRLILTHSTNTNVEYVVKNTDIAGSTITIPNIPYVEGSNTISIKLIDTNGQETNSVQKNFIVDTVNPSAINLGNITITEDVDGNGKILANEDVGNDKITSFKVTLPNGVQEGDKVEVVLNNLKKIYVVQAQDLQGNREINVNGVAYQEGVNQATINIVDSHGVTHSTITKDFTVDTLKPQDITINNIRVIEDANNDGKILSSEEQGGDKFTNITVVLPNNIAQGDRVILTHGGGTEIEYVIKSSDRSGNSITIENIPYIEGTNNISLKIIDINGQTTSVTQKSFIVDTTNPTSPNDDKIVILEDANKDGRISVAEDIGNDQTTAVKITIPSGMKVGDKIEITNVETNSTIEHVLRDTDVEGSEITIDGLRYQVGSNTLRLKLIDEHGVTHITKDKIYNVDAPAPALPSVTSITALEDVNKNGRIEKVEDTDRNGGTPLKIDIPRGLDTSYRISLNINGAVTEHALTQNNIREGHIIIQSGVLLAGANNISAKILKNTDSSGEISINLINESVIKNASDQCTARKQTHDTFTNNVFTYAQDGIVYDITTTSNPINFKEGVIYNFEPTCSSMVEVRGLQGSTYNIFTPIDPNVDETVNTWIKTDNTGREISQILSTNTWADRLDPTYHAKSYFSMTGDIRGSIVNGSGGAEFIYVDMTRGNYFRDLDPAMNHYAIGGQIKLYGGNDFVDISHQTRMDVPRDYNDQNYFGAISLIDLGSGNDALSTTIIRSMATAGYSSYQYAYKENDDIREIRGGSGFDIISINPSLLGHDYIRTDVRGLTEKTKISEFEAMSFMMYKNSRIAEITIRPDDISEISTGKEGSDPFRIIKGFDPSTTGAQVLNLIFHGFNVSQESSNRQGYVRLEGRSSSGELIKIDVDDSYQFQAGGRGLPLYNLDSSIANQLQSQAEVKNYNIDSNTIIHTDPTTGAKVDNKGNWFFLKPNISNNIMVNEGNNKIYLGKYGGDVIQLMGGGNNEVFLGDNPNYKISYDGDQRGYVETENNVIIYNDQGNTIIHGSDTRDVVRAINFKEGAILEMGGGNDEVTISSPNNNRISVDGGKGDDTLIINNSNSVGNNVFTNISIKGIENIVLNGGAKITDLSTLKDMIINNNETDTVMKINYGGAGMREIDLTGWKASTDMLTGYKIYEFADTSTSKIVKIALKEGNFTVVGTGVISSASTNSSTHLFKTTDWRDDNRVDPMMEKLIKEGKIDLNKKVKVSGLLDDGEHMILPKTETSNQSNSVVDNAQNISSQTGSLEHNNFINDLCLEVIANTSVPAFKEHDFDIPNS